MDQKKDRAQGQPFDPRSLTPVQALARLVQGNRRFASGLRSVENAHSPGHLRFLAKEGQRPFCIVLSCSDSRVPAEMIFDQGLGDVFVVRVAGNVVAPSLLASIEFAATQFESPLLVVMGHTGCGAIASAIDCDHNHQQVWPKLSPNLQDLITRITPSVLKHRHLSDLGHKKDEVTIENVRHSMLTALEQSSILQDRFRGGKLLVVGSVFDLHSGGVHFMIDQEMEKQVEQVIQGWTPETVPFLAAREMMPRAIVQ